MQKKKLTHITPLPSDIVNSVTMMTVRVRLTYYWINQYTSI